MADQAIYEPLERARMLRFGSQIRPHFYTVLLIILGYVLAIAGSVVIGATNYGILVVGGLFAMLLGLVMLLRPEIGLYILVISVFTNMSSVLQISFGIPSTNKPLVALIFVGTLASRIVLRRKPLIFRGTELVILSFGMTMLLSLLVAQIPNDTRVIMLDWAKDFAILLIVVQLADEEAVWKRMQWALLLSALFLGVLSAYQVVTGNFGNSFFGFGSAPQFEVVTGFDYNRVTGPLDDPNYYGMVMLMTVPIAFYRMMTEPRRILRILGAIIFVTVTATVLFTYSRGAFLALVVVAILMVRERRMNLYKLGLGLLILGLILIPVLPQGFSARLNTLTSVLPSNAQLQLQTETSFRGRTSEALVALQMFRDYPILGVGRGNYATSYLAYSSRLGLDPRLENRQAHSLYLEVLAEMGIVGAIVFGAMLFVLFWGLRRSKQLLVASKRRDLLPWVSGIQYGLLAYLLASLFLHADYMRYMWLIIGFAASTSVMAAEQYQIANKTEIVPE